MAVLTAAFAVAFFRLGGASTRGVLWAEDGALLLQQAYQSDPLTHLLDSYGGYGLVTPRLVTWLVVACFPVAWHGVVMCGAAALIQAIVGLFAYHVVTAHTGYRGAAIVAVAAVSCVPVGTEVVDSLANSHWFLLVGALLAPLWAPARRSGKVATVLMVLAGTTASPFAAPVLPVALLIWWATRDRAVAGLALTAAVGLAAQWSVILRASDRPQPSVDPDLDVIAQQWFARVLGDGVLGIARHDLAPAPSLTAGFIVAGALAVLLVRLALRQGAHALVLPAYLILIGLVVYFPPLLLSAVDTTNPGAAGRYYVAPVVLLLTAIGVVVQRVLEDTRARPAPVPASVGVAVTSAALVVCMGTGLVTNWQVDDGGSRSSLDGWSRGVTEARKACAKPDPPDTVTVPIAPPGWGVLVACERIAH
jgi:hypothetical protein